MLQKIYRAILRKIDPGIVFIDGKVSVKQWDKLGNLKLSKNLGSNIITTVGKAQLALLAGTVATPFTYLALGTSATAPAITDIALGAEISTNGLARFAATVSRVTTTTTNDTLSMVGNWTASGISTIAEIGQFNASSSGVILGHKLTSSITTAVGDNIQFTYTVQFS